MRFSEQESLDRCFFADHVYVSINSLPDSEFRYNDPQVDGWSEPFALPDWTQILMTKADFQAAIDENQFRLVFQPKIDCATRMLSGFEALVRWDHPERGLVMPELFIPLAEGFDLIGKMTDQIVGLALDWYSHTPEVQDTSISINVSERTLDDPEFPDRLRKACEKAGVEPEVLILEFSVESALKDEKLSHIAFGRLLEAGFRVSVDHFGIGSETIDSLRQLPISELKVDKSISINSSLSSEYKTRIKSLIGEGQKLGLSMVIEGVEDRETLHYLRTVGCDLAQGYYVACPMGGDLVSDWIVAHNHARERNLL